METSRPTSAIFQVAEIQLTYRCASNLSDSPSIRQSHDAFKVLSACWNPDTIGLFEEFKILLLNRASKVLGVVNVSTGGITGTVADVRLIFAAALKGVACSMILSHNHPSGNLKPSEVDLSLTRKLVDGAKILDLTILDHIILTPEGTYMSMADEGLM